MNKLKRKKNILTNKKIFKKSNNKKIYNKLFNALKLYENKKYNILEFNKKKTINIPKKNNNFFFTINKRYKNFLLLNYKINYNILFDFNKRMFVYKKNQIKGRIFIFYNKNEKDFILNIFFLGIIFSIKKTNLYDYYFILNAKNNIYLKIKKEKKYNYYKTKKTMDHLIIDNFNFKYINLTIKKTFLFFLFTRISYIEKLKLIQK
jgi:hypothetical protein